MAIIAFSGLKGSGKTTAAKYLRSRHGYELESFAAPLKRAAAEIFGLEPEQLFDRAHKERVDAYWGMSPREILQRLGTEVGREFSEDLWIKSLKRRLDSKGDDIVIDDCRFLNEAQAIVDMGGVVVRISRGDAVASEHLSEAGMNEDWGSLITYKIKNDGPSSELFTTLDRIHNLEYR